MKLNLTIPTLKKLVTRIGGPLLIALFINAPTVAQMPIPEWVDSVGAQTAPSSEFILKVNDFGANNNGLILATEAIQRAIDSCASRGGGKVIFDPGVYLTGAIFLKSNVELNIGAGVELRATMELKEYPEIDTRVAGIEMRWPAAVINVLNQQNALVSGKGTVHAQGRIHWERYWNLREEYTPKGLRWAADYDCKRVRTILVSDSKNITLKELTLKQAGFWTVHLLYSSNITVDGLIIQNNIDGHGPSTDGIDIDSSTRILVQNCDIDCNDDNFCLKAGRDADGLRVNRPTEFVVIRDCYSRQGGGLVTIGSETSGGIRHVYVSDLKADNTNTAIRFKSAVTRGGGLSDIYISNIDMKDVKLPLEVTLNWNPAYSYASLENHTGSIPSYWKVLLEEVPANEGIPEFHDVYICDISASNAEVAINVAGMKDSYIKNFTLKNVKISSRKPGQIMYTENWNLDEVQIISANKAKLKMGNNIAFTATNSSF